MMHVTLQPERYLKSSGKLYIIVLNALKFTAIAFFYSSSLPPSQVVLLNQVTTKYTEGSFQLSLALGNFLYLTFHCFMLNHWPVLIPMIVTFLQATCFLLFQNPDK